MAEGTVKFFDDERGWGFIRPDAGGPDCFVHYSKVVGSGRRTLLQGQRVRFTVETTEKGLQALDVEVLA